MTREELLQKIHKMESALSAVPESSLSDKEWLELNIYRIIRDFQKREALLVEALDGILSIGKRDMTNEKYDGYFEAAKETLARINSGEWME